MMFRRAMLWSLAVLMGTSASAWATTEQMQKLPVSDRFGCLICHETAAPQTADLNVFGTAFQENGSQWDAALAAASTDPDGCANGFELGDEDGDGKLDANVVQERYNPSQNDCPLQIRQAAWSQLKSLFRQ